MTGDQLLQALVSGGLISQEDSQKVLREANLAGKTPETVLYEKRTVDDEKIAQVKSQLLKIPFQRFPATSVEDSILHIIPEETARNYGVAPLSKQGDMFVVGMINPDDFRARDALRFILLRKRLEPRVYLITKSDFNRAVNQYKTLRGEIAESVVRLKKEFEDIFIGEKEGEGEKVIEEAPVTKILAVILKHATDGNASDVHIEPLENKVRVRFRVDGVLHTSLTLPRDINQALVAHIKILANLRIDESRVPQDGRFRTKIGDKYIDLRVSTFPASDGEKVAIRILDTSSGVKYLKDLGLEGKYIDVLERAISKPFGMVLITGPTGAGKSTTLYALLNILNKEGINIISLEDPIEYYIEGVNQSQVRPEIGYDFASGLRSVLRQDPDVIMVGEIRDPETAGLGVHAALTGHVVLSTLHTNNALGVIPRLIDMKVEPYLLPSALNLAVAQRLVKKLCPDCKKAVKPNKEILDMIKFAFEEVGPEELNSRSIDANKEIVIYEPQGCPKCLHKGTKGRLAIFEMFEMTGDVENVILHDLSEANLEKETKKQKMISMRNDGILKVVKGMVSLGDVVKVVEVG